MPSTLHEALVEMLALRPALVAELLSGALEVPVPAHEQARVERADLADLVATEYRADAVVVLFEGPDAVLCVVVEVQLGRDPDKRWTWPVYVATLRARWECPAELLVVCPDRAVARWCAEPIELGLDGSRVAPRVLGPDRVPVVTDVERARRAPELAVLSALAHGGDPQHADVLDVLLPAMDTVDDEHALLYLEVVWAALPDAARSYLGGLVTTPTEHRSEFAQWLFAQGQAKGQAEAVLAVLRVRGITVPDRIRERVLASRDLSEVERWLARAETVAAADELFA